MERSSRVATYYTMETQKFDILKKKRSKLNFDLCLNAHSFFNIGPTEVNNSSIDSMDTHIFSLQKKSEFNFDLCWIAYLSFLHYN